MGNYIEVCCNPNIFMKEQEVSKSHPLKISFPNFLQIIYFFVAFDDELRHAPSKKNPL